MSAERQAELTELWLDGALDAAEAAELRRLLADPATRAGFVAEVRFSVRLGARLHRPAIALDERVAALLAAAGGGAQVAEAVATRLVPTTRRLRRARRQRRPARSFLWLGALAALLLLAFGIAWHQLPRSTGAEASGHAVAAGDRLHGPEHLRFADGSAVDLDNGAELELVALAPKRLRLVAGALDARVAKQPADAPLVIATPWADATVVGTRFHLDCGRATTRLAVSEGLVRFATTTTALDVPAGRSAETGADGGLAFTAPMSPPAAPAIDPLGRLVPDGGRPFSADSPWNATIAPTAERDQQSTAMAARLGNDPALALYRYAIPVYETTAATPVRQVTCPSRRFDGFAVRVPDEARPNSGSNASLLVIDWQARRTWEFWHFAWEDGGITCAGGGQIPLDGGGTDRPSPGHAGGSMLAGLIRQREIAAGRIPHALTFGSCRAGHAFRFPAYQSDGDDESPDALPVGARIQLDPALDLAAIPGLTPGERAIARALQEYGAYCVGRSRKTLCFFAELAHDAADVGHPGTVYAAAGLDRDDFALPHIPWDALRVLK